MLRKNFILLMIVILVAAACTVQPKQVEPTPTAAPTLTSTPIRLPVSEAEVLRTTVEEAKTALDNKTAILVDVRSPSSFEISHISGALNISLSDIELNPTSLKLDKNQWLITYCT